MLTTTLVTSYLFLKIRQFCTCLQYYLLTFYRYNTCVHVLVYNCMFCWNVCIYSLLFISATNYHVILFFSNQPTVIDYFSNQSPCYSFCGNQLFCYFLCKQPIFMLYYVSLTNHSVFFFTATNHPVIRKQTFIHILEWFKSACTKFDEEFFESSKVGITLYCGEM